MSQYGSYQYESTESRALKTITADSYNKDQAKNLIQLNQNSEYMAQYLRKLQKGVDEANENILEQAQSLITDFIVLLGGNGDTGLDFGDLKYVIQAIGALFGFTNSEGEIQLPVNVFAAAWHFFSSYIMPVGDFSEFIDALIDQAIAGILGMFGEVPIVGEALQQLAVIITDIRDLLMPLIEAVEALFEVFGGSWTIGDLGIFGDLFDALNELISPILGPPIAILGEIFQVMVTWTVPFVQALTYVVNVVTNLIRSITGSNHDWNDFTLDVVDFNPVTMLANIIDALIDNDLFAILPGANIVGTILATVIPGLDASKITSGSFPQSMINGLVSLLSNFPVANLVGTIATSLIPGLDASKITSGTFAQSMITGLTSLLAAFPVGNLVGTIASSLIPGLDASKIVSGTFAQSLVTGLTTSLGTINTNAQTMIDSIIQGAGNLVGTGFAVADMIAQLTGLRNATAGANAAVTTLQAQVAGLDPAASSEAINFAEFVNAAAPPSMFTKFSDSGSGSLTTSGGQLVWSGSSAGRELYLFNEGPLLSNLFEVSVVLPSVPSHGWFGDDGANYIWLIGRSNSDGTALVAMRVAWDEIRFYNLASGTFTQIGTTLSQTDVITGGCQLTFKGGNAAESRYFEAKVNGTKVHSHTDTTPVTLLGSDYRYCGFGVEKGSSYDTAKISTWSMLDGGALAGSGVVAGYTSTGLTNLNIWKGTAAQYAAITTKNANTIYFVKG